MPETSVASIALLGETLDVWQDALRDVPCAVDRSGTLEHALEFAQAQAAPGDVILLSPAAASYDQFTNFAERGHAFAALAGFNT